MLLDKIKKKIDKARIVSFDIFDTLLVRPYIQPDDLFEHLGILENISDFRQIRKAAFEQAVNKYKTPEIEEVTLEQIYEFVPVKYQYLKEKELELEFQVLQTNTELMEVYQYALSKMKKIIIVSDMYLSQDFIKNALAKNGYDKYEKLFLSSEYKKLKFTGNLFKQIFDELHVKPDNILHIGDNKYSDFETPRKLGIKAVKYEKISNQFFSKNKRAKKFYKLNSNNITISILMGCIALTRNEKHNYWYKLGFQYGGAFIFSYMYWLNNILSRDSIKEILFVARDGYTLEKVYKIINKNSNQKTHYFYAPRLISVCCSLDIDDKIKASDFECIDAISSIINYFKPETASKFEIPKLETKKDYLSFWTNHKKDYQELSKIEYEQYKNYLTSLNLEENKIAFVDVMTTFFTAHKFVQKVLSNKTIKGYYYLVSDYYNPDTSGLKYENYTGRLFNVKFMELLISSPEAPIIRVEAKLPVYKEVNKHDKFRMNIYPYIAQGELDFATLFTKCFGEHLIQLDTEIICKWIDSFSENFVLNDYLNLRHLTHSWNVNHSKYSLLFDELSWKNWIQTIFSVKNSSDKKHKIVKILGLKIKFKRKKK